MKNGYTAYNSTNVETADQGKLILIAYDVAIKHCKLSLDKFEEKKLIEERTRHLCKVQDAITELMSSLKLDVGEVAHNLYRLYDYMIRRCIEANVKSDKRIVVEILGHLEALRDAWNQAIINVRKESAPKPEKQPPEFRDNLLKRENIMDIREHLTASRNDLTEIESLTKKLGNEPSIEDIESVLRRRDTLVTRMKHGQQQLAGQDAQWSACVEGDPFLKTLFDESKALLRSVADIDGRLSVLIELRMKSVRRQLSSLYHTSRAAYSYTYHSGFRPAR